MTNVKPISYTDVHDWPNLLWAHAKARKGKRGRDPAARFEFRLEDNLIAIQDELRSKTYRPGGYDSFYIHEPKRRLISAAPFRDRVVHHALVNVIQPVFEQSFISDSYANRIRKGTHRAIERAQVFARRFRYVLACDVQQFFPAVDHSILRRILARKIKDPGVMWLAGQILDSGNGLLRDSYDMIYFPGDDLFAINRPRGLPIGNLTSQFWANCYLNSFDHFVKRELRSPGYLRYVDDMLLFHDDKQRLWEYRQRIIERMARLRLTIHDRRAGVHETRAGIPFLGFVVFPHKRRLKRRRGVDYARRLRRLSIAFGEGRISMEAVKQSVQGWVNHAGFGDTKSLRRDILGSVVFRYPKDGHSGNNAVIHQNF